MRDNLDIYAEDINHQFEAIVKSKDQLKEPIPIQPKPVIIEEEEKRNYDVFEPVIEERQSQHVAAIKSICCLAKLSNTPEKCKRAISVQSRKSGSPEKAEWRKRRWRRDTGRWTPCWKSLDATRREQSDGRFGDSVWDTTHRRVSPAGGKEPQDVRNDHPVASTN